MTTDGKTYFIVGEYDYDQTDIDYDQTYIRIYVAEPSDAQEAKDFFRAVADDGEIELAAIVEDPCWLGSEQQSYERAVRLFTPNSVRAMRVIGEERTRPLLGNDPGVVCRRKFREAFGKSLDGGRGEAARVATNLKAAMASMEPATVEVLKQMLGDVLGQ